MVRTEETRAKIGKVIREQWADPAIREVSGVPHQRHLLHWDEIADEGGAPRLLLSLF